MSGAVRKSQLSDERFAVDQWGYPAGMVWCPMKMSGMAVIKCAELQKEFGCGSLRQLQIITSTKPGNVPFFWPWLGSGRECPERASEKQVRELRLALSPLRSVEQKTGKILDPTVARLAAAAKFSAPASVAAVGVFP